MAWTCSNCGNLRCADDQPACQTCGHRRLGTLELVSAVTGRALRFAIPTTVGRPVLRGVDLDGARFASLEQFAVEEGSSGAWRLRPCPEARNPTWVDGAPAPAEGQTLTTGAVVSIGGKQLRLDVRIHP